MLSDVAKLIENCKECKVGTTGKAVPGEGNPRAKIMFVGEAPGKQEAATGRPFIGRSGQLLDKLIESAGLKREDVFITSIGKYLPIQGTPNPFQIKHGATHLQKQIEIIKPKIIVTLGRVAASGLGFIVSVTKDHGKIIEKDGKTYMVTLHPAAALRFPPLKAVLEEDFKKLASIV
jgi:uracil-DNA glycosylase